LKTEKKHGPYASLNDFLSRVHNRSLNKKSLEALILTGALDRFGERGEMQANVEMMLTFNKEQVAEKESAQESLFNLMGQSSGVTLNLAKTDPMPTIQKLTWEKELLGVYVSGHPLDEFQAELDKRPSIASIKQDNRNGIPVVTAGMISSVRELLTKKGDKMAFIMLENHTDQIEMVAFPKTYTELKNILTVGNCIAVKGKLTIRNDEPSVALDRAKSLSTSNQEHPT
jgi:DNA polymerase-3 subunit alpha